MTLCELVAHTMQLITLNRDIISKEKIKLGYKSPYLQDSKYSDIFINVLDRIHNGFNELLIHDKIPFVVEEIETSNNTITINNANLVEVKSVFSVASSSIKNYEFRDLGNGTIRLLSHCPESIHVMYSVSIPLFTISDLEREEEINFKDFNLSNMHLNCVAKYACAEMQEHIDTYRGYSNKQEALMEIMRLPNTQTLPIQDRVECHF